MLACPYCSSSGLTRDSRDQRGRVIRACRAFRVCRACGRHATSESTSLVVGHRFPRTIILLAVRYYLQLGAAAERIAGILADRGIDVSGRTILRWVQKFGPALSEEIRRYRQTVSTTWLVDETYAKIRGRWHDLYRGSDQDGQVPRLLVVADARPSRGRGLLPSHDQFDWLCA
jgi:transposase-like protein